MASGHTPGVPVPAAASYRRVRPAPRSSGLIAWLAPDVAMTFAIITLLSLFLVFDGSTAFFEDADTGWHIRNGERILSSKLLPKTDSFSFSKPGAPLIAWEWASDALMGATYRVSGLGGIALSCGLAIAACVWMWFRFSRAAGGNVLIACLFFVPMLAATRLHWLARPHVLSWLFLIGTVWWCERMPRRLTGRHLALAAIVGAAWANLHASFFFAPLIALIYAAGAFVKPLIWAARETSAGEIGAARAYRYTLVAIAASVGTLANPNGWQLHRHILSFLGDSRMLDQIAEFRSLDFHARGAVYFIIMLAICFGGAFAALAARKPERFVLSMLLTATALRSLRVLPVAALLVLPLANGSITSVLSRAGNLAPEFRRRLHAALRYGDRLQTIERRLHGFAIVPFAAILILAAIRMSAGFPAGVFPVAASVLVANLPAGARILAPDTFGSYLIYRFNGKPQVFIDERNDFYGSEFSDRYLSLIEVRPGWREEFDRWSFTNALLPPDCRLIPALKANGWKELYRDRTAVLLTGRSRL